MIKGLSHMTEQCRFTDPVKAYLIRFYAILDEMLEGMECVQLSDSISHNFIVQMIPHHQAAIEMSNNVLRYTDCAPLRNIAQNIISEQTRSIQDMLDIKCRCSTPANSRIDRCLYQRHFQQIVHTMFTEMDMACSDNNISNNFLREMIPHHMGAVRMSENALRYCICPQLQPMLTDMINSQRKEIQEMEALLQTSVCQE